MNTSSFFIHKTLFIVCTVLLFGLPLATFASFGDSTNYVGQLKYGDGLDKLSAYFDFPEDITADGAGNFYIADTYNGVIRKIDSSGNVSTAVGQGGYGDVNGSGSSSTFAHPGGVAVDSSGNIYIADSGNGKIKKYNGNRVTTLASDLERPEGIFVRNNTVYFLDYSAGRLYSMNTNGGNFKLITSDLNKPKKLYVRTTDNYAYITNAGDYTVVRVKLDGGFASIIAGTSGASGKNNGACLISGFKNLWGLTVIEGSSLDEDDIYVTDGTGDPGNLVDRDIFIQNTADAGKVRVIDINGSNVPESTEDTESISTEAVTSSEVPQLQDSNCETYLYAKDNDNFAINYPNSITRYGDYVYVAITGISKIAKMKIGDSTDISVWAGKNRFHNRNGLNGLPGRPKDLALTQNKSKLYFSENNQIRYITTQQRRVKRLVGNTIDNYQKHDDKGWKGNEGRFSDPLALTLSKNEKKLYVVDRNNNRIREVNIAQRKVYYLTGAGEVNVGGGADNGYNEGRACANVFETGRSRCAYFTRPAGIALDPSGKYVYVADTGNEVIRRVQVRGANKGKTKFIAGKVGSTGFKNGSGESARFNVPISLTIDSAGDYLYVADRNNHAIRKVRISDGRVTTLVGDPSTQGYLDGRLSDAQLNLPVEVYYNKGNIYFSEAGTHMVRVVDMADEAVKLVAGDGSRGYSNGDRDNAQFDNPVGMVRKGNNILLADSQNDLIRKIDLGDGETIPYTDPGPGVTSVSPQSNKVAGSTSDTKALQVFGGEFRNGAVAYFGPFQANATYVNSDSELSVVIPFGKMDPGYYQIKVVNSDGQSGYLSRGYSISDNNGSVPVTDYWAD